MINLFISWLLRRNPKNNDSNIIRHPQSYIVMSICCCVGFFLLYLFLLMLAIFSPETIENYDSNTIWIISLIFGIIITLYIIFIIYLVKFKIEVKDDCFIYHNLFKKTKSYSYEEITLKLIGSSYHVYKESKLIVKISLLFDNANLLNSTMQKHLKQHKIKPKINNYGVIKRSKLWVLISIGFLIPVVLLNVLAGIYESWWYWTLFCHLPNLIYIAYNLVWKISFESNNTITIRNLFFKKNLPFDELEYSENNSLTVYKIYHKNKLLAIVLAIEYNSDLVEKHLRLKF